MSSASNDHLCLDCQGYKEEDLCPTCFRKKYLPVRDVTGIDAPIRNAPILDGPIVDAPILDGQVLNAPIVDGPVLDAAIIDDPFLNAAAKDDPIIDAQDANEDNEGSMRHLMEIIKINPPMLFGFCVECEEWNICQNAKAHRILQWVEDSYRYRKQRELDEVYVTWIALPYELISDNDDYTPLNLDEVDV